MYCDVYCTPSGVPSGSALRNFLKLRLYFTVYPYSLQVDDKKVVKELLFGVKSWTLKTLNISDRFNTNCNLGNHPYLLNLY